MGSGGGGGGGGVFGGGGGGSGGALCTGAAGVGGGGGGGSSVAITLIDGVNAGDGSLTISASAQTSSAPLTKPATAVSIRPRFTG
jgi:hypothetical protein